MSTYTSNLFNDLEFYLGQILSLYEAKYLGQILTDANNIIMGGEGQLIHLISC